jgi:hypothetical protein
MALAMAAACIFPALNDSAYASESSAIYYVSSNGNDDNPGTLEQPFQTIGKAASVMEAGDKTVVREGTYREEVAPAHSGTEQLPIRFEAYPGESVTVSGLDVVSPQAWSLPEGSDIYEAEVIMPLSNENQVFVDQQLQTIARYPNKGTPELMSMGEVLTVDWKVDNATVIKDDELTEEAGFYEGATLWIQDEWHYNYYTAPITASAPGEIAYDWTGQPDQFPKPAAGSHYFVSGKLNLLDTAGEWMYESGKLYLRATGDVNPAELEVAYKARRYAFDVSGRAHVQISGIRMEAASVKTDAESTHLLLDGVDMEYVYHSNDNQYPDSPGLVDPWNEDRGFTIWGDHSTIQNSQIRYSSANGIKINANGVRVLNNLIHDIGYNGTHAGAVNNVNTDLSLGNQTLIAYNTIKRVGRSAIPTDVQNTRITHNDISEFMMIATDGGALYSWGAEANGTVEIDHNVIHDSAEGKMAVGLYLDNGTKGYLVHHNVVYNVETTMFMNAPNNDNKIYNNTLYGGRAIGVVVMHIHNVQVGADWRGNEIFNNILGPFLPGDHAAIGHNLYSHYLDHRFVDAENGNMSIQPGSAAQDQGVVIPGITDGYEGAAPDVGAYEIGAEPWTAGWNPARNVEDMTYELTQVNFTPTYGNAFLEEDNISGVDMMRSGGFENGKTGWDEDWYETTTVVDNPTYEGAKALKLGPAGGGMAQWIKVEPNTTYYMSAAQMSNNYEIPNTVGIHFYTDRDQELIYQYFLNTGTSTYSRKGVFFTTPDNSTYIRVYSAGWTEGQDNYVDDIRVFKPEYHEDYPAEVRQSEKPEPPKPTVSSEEPQTLNYALKRPVYVSSNELTVEGNPAWNVGEFAVDGLSWTRWASEWTLPWEENPKYPQWIYVDLGEPKTISQVRLLWEGSFGKSYRIQVSNDATEWADVFVTTSGNGGWDNIQFDAVDARYVRMYGEEISGNSFGFSLYEFEVYGLDNEHYEQGNLLTNSGFEEGTLYWSDNTDSGVFTSAPVFEGQRSLRLQEGPIQLEQTELVEVKGNTDYMLIGAGKVSGTPVNGEQLEWGIDWLNGDGDWIRTDAIPYTLTQYATEWNTFLSPEEAVQAKVWLSKSGGSESQFYLDGLNLFEYAFPQGNLIQNASFESDLSNWNITDGDPLHAGIEVSDPARQASHAIMTGPSQTYQRVDVPVPGALYKLQAWGYVTEALEDGAAAQVVVKELNTEGQTLAVHTLDFGQEHSYIRKSDSFHAHPSSAQFEVEMILETTGEARFHVDQVTVAPQADDNLAPVFEEQQTEYQLKSGAAVNIYLKAMDENAGDRIVFTSAGLPQTASLAPLTGLFSWKPSTSQVGEHEVTFTVSDGKDTSDIVFQFEVVEDDYDTEPDNGSGNGNSNVPPVNLGQLLPLVRDGMAVAEVTLENWKRAIQQAESNPEGKVISIGLKEIMGATSYQLLIPSAVFDSSNDLDSVVLSTPLGDMQLPLQMFSQMDLTDADRIGIAITQSHLDNWSAPWAVTLSNRPIVDLQITIDGTKVDWSNSKRHVTVSLPYQIGDFEQPQAMTVWHLEKPNKVNPVPSARYNAATGKITFQLHHFSTYAIVHNPIKFKDVPANHYAKDAIEILAAKGIVSGKGNNRYDPQAIISRADFVLLLLRALDVPMEKAKATFQDVKPSDYYGAALTTAHSLGIASGDGTNFNPKHSVTREQLAALTFRALMAVGMPLPATEGNALEAYDDSDMVSPYAVRGFVALLDAGIMVDQQGLLQPNTAVTRAEAAVIIKEMMTWLYA